MIRKSSRGRGRHQPRQDRDANRRGREGEQTQVVFLKRQEYRTDLFGVGAIAFDLISCGRSSERFYESIRRFEFDGSGPAASRARSASTDASRMASPMSQNSSTSSSHSGMDPIRARDVRRVDPPLHALQRREDVLCAYGTSCRTQQISATPAFEDPRSRAILDVLAYIDNELDYRNNRSRSTIRWLR